MTRKNLDEIEKNESKLLKYKGSRIQCFQNISTSKIENSVNWDTIPIDEFHFNKRFLLDRNLLVNQCKLLNHNDLKN